MNGIIKRWLKKDFWTIWDTTDKILCWLGMHHWYTAYFLDRNVAWPRFKIDWGVRTCHRSGCTARQTIKRSVYNSDTGCYDNKIRWENNRR